MPIELVLLDFDGTLVDTAPDLIRTANIFLKHHGHRGLPEEVIRGGIGHGLKNLVHEIFPESINDAAHMSRLEQQFRNLYDDEFLKSPAFYPGALEFLNSWPDKFAIVSNKRTRYILPILKHLGVDKLPWSAIIGGDSFPQMKPHPTPFLEAMKIAGTDRAKTVMVGDGEPDIEGAVAVGMRSIAVSFGYSPLQRLVHLGATATIDSYSELRERIEELG